MIKYEKSQVDKKRGWVSHCIEDKDGAMIMEKDKILKHWEEYIRELFDGDKGDINVGDA